MNCARCGGLIIETYAVSMEGSGLYQRCINCGRRPEEMATSEARQEHGLRTLPPKSKSEEEDEGMPKFVSEEHRQRWIEGQRRAREAKQQTAGSVSEPKAKPPVKAKPTVKSTPKAAPVTPQDDANWPEWKAGLIDQLIDAESKLEAKLSAVRAAQVAIQAL